MYTIGQVSERRFFKMKKLISIIILLAMLSCTIIMAIPAAAKGPVFSDVKDGAWYAKAVNSLNGLGIVNGDRGKFYPEMNISRCEFAMILSSLAGADTSAYEAAPFFDVEAGKWYSGAIAWAYAEGIVKGETPTSFAPKAPITREEICTMVARLIWKYELSEDGIPPRFTDDADIHGWANESVYSCRFLGIVNGYKDGSFRPGNLTKRCEAAQIIYQLLVKYCDKITGLSMEEALERATITGIDGYDVGFPVATEGYAVRCNGCGPNLPPGAPKTGEIRVITSKEAMAEYVNLPQECFYYCSDNGPIPVYGLTDVLLSYNDEFFSKHDIAIVRLSTSSGSFGVRFVSVDYKEGKFIFSANMHRPTEGWYTCDIGYWCVWAVVPKGTVNQNNITLEYNTVYD